MKVKTISRYFMLSTILLLSTCLTVSCGKQQTSPTNETSVMESTTETATDEQTTKAELASPTTNQTEPIVYFSSPSGFYEDELTLTLQCPVEDATIFYTTDGSIPTKDSIKYEAPITLRDKSDSPEVYAARTDYCTDSQYVPIKPIKKGNIIRAIAYFPDETYSIVTNATYFVGLDRKSLYGDAPVISLITDPENLFHEEKGIFVLGKTYQEWLKEDPKNAEEPSYKVHGNFSNKGKDWERPVYFEYMPAEGENISADMGLRMKGATTRAYLQKSMRLIARSDYGTSKIQASLIPDNMKSDHSGQVDTYKSFVLRNGGNDNGFGKLRDPLIQKLVSDRNLDTQASTPCVVFLDGEYWGLYALTEDYSDNYIETNYGVDKDQVVIIKCGKIDEGKDEDITLYEELYNFITRNDMTNIDNYEKACEMMDMPGFIDYCAIQLYIDNHDSIFDDNNWSFWRTRDADGSTKYHDGKWRVLLYDTEFSTGVYSGGEGFLDNTMQDDLNAIHDTDKEYQSDYPALHIFDSLYKNEQFKHDLIVTLCDLRNYNFEKSKAQAQLDDMAITYKKLAPDSFYRYGPDWVVMWGDPSFYYEEKIKELRKYLSGRYMAFSNIMQETFSLQQPVNVTINVSDPSLGGVQLNHTNLDFANISTGQFSGIYFTEYDITLTAIPQDGHKFVKWVVNGTDITDTTVTITLQEETDIQLIYE